MVIRSVVRAVLMAVLVGLLAGPGARAQQQPSATAVALATQILELKGGIALFDPAIDGVINHHKAAFIQMNPNVAKTLNDMDATFRADLATKRQQLHVEVAHAYAAQFSEQELKDLLAFYRSPLGKKVIEGEPKAVDEAAKRAQVWIDKYADEVASKMRAELKRKGFNEF